MTDNPAETGPTKAASQLNESLSRTAQSQRALVEEITSFAKDEGLRFANLRLERNGAALDKLQNCHGLPGLIGVQQEWLRDFLQDYASQNLRFAGSFRGLAQNAMASATEAASDTIDRVQHEAADMVHQGGEQVRQAAQDAETYAQETTH